MKTYTGLKSKQIDLINAIGKTISKILLDDSEKELWIIYNDNTFSFIEISDNDFYQREIIPGDSFYFTTCSFYDSFLYKRLKELDLLDEESLKPLMDKQHERFLIEDRKRKELLFEQLKKELGK